jgi:glycine hydroxymethyltransferase
LQCPPLQRSLAADAFTEHRRSSSPARSPTSDPEIFGAIEKELGRQRHEIELIASENIVSRAVLEAQGSIMTNKYAEGYPGKRYYGGCQYRRYRRGTRHRAREEALRRQLRRTCSRIPASQMNQAVFLALLQPGDTFMGLDLNSGGHLTHGSPVNMSGKWFNVVSYGVREGDQPARHGRGRQRKAARAPSRS